MYVFFFFKQKTAYEMRISDWSSDVCSSDLIEPAVARRQCDVLAVGMAEGPAPRGRAASGRVGPRPADIHVRLFAAVRRGDNQQIGRASCRERVCPYV